MIELIILGSGGFAHVIADALRRCRTPATSYVDRAAASNFSELNYFGDDQALLARGPDGVMLVNGIGSSKVPNVRRQIFELYKDAGFRFATVVDPSALVASNAVLDEGAQVVAGAILQPNVRIGRNALINVGALVNHDSQIGDHVHIATGVIIAGDVIIGQGTMVGAGATIIQGVHIGSGALVAAGATVICDVGDGDRVAGVPARSMGEKD